MATNKAFDFLNKYRKPILIVLVIVAVYLLWNKHGYKLTRLFKPAQENNAPIPLSDVRKQQIENLMAEIHEDISDTDFWGGHHYDIYNQFLGFYDDEMRYGADYYKNFLASGTSFYDDLDGEYFLWSDVNTKVLDKLKEIGRG